MSEKSAEYSEKINRAKEDESLFITDLNVTNNGTYPTKEGRPFLEKGTKEYDLFLKKAQHLKNRRTQLEEKSELATHDSLTGLLNRRGFDERLKEEFKASKRYNHHLAVIILDLDRFKTVNDKEGHMAGDTVLIEVADSLKSTFRDIDVISRWGGDEFAIILRETNKKGLANLLKRFRSSLKEKNIKAGKTKEITSSIGVAYLYQRGDTTNDLLERADKALYKVKRSGRDGIKIARRGLHGEIKFSDVH